MIFQAVAANDSNPDVHRKRLAWLEDCNRRGIPMYSQGSAGRQGIELTFEDWNLFDAVPSWREATTGSHEEKKLKMQDPDLRVKLREEYDSGMRPNVASVEGLMVMEVYNDSLRDYEGMTVTQIAEKEGKHVVDALLDVVVADDLNTEFLSESTRKDPTYSAEVMRSPYVSSGTSDGGAHVKFITAGSYPTDFLIWMVREEGALTLEQAHYKLSYQNAFFGGFKDRGLIREGVPADVVVYDLDKLKVLDAEVIEDLPGGEWRRIQRSEGYRWTIVNGDVTLEDGIPTGAMPGKLLRHGKA
jgi:N-acyl-D-aspartate/D-glutamate deacylase